MADEKRVPKEKVTQGNVTRKKASGKRKFLNLFIEEDLDSIKEYAIEDLIVPEIKNGILDILSMLLTGRGNSRSSGGGRNEREDYVSYSKGTSRRNKYQEDRKRRYRTYSDIDEILFESRIDADRVLKELDYYSRKYGQVTVTEFYEFSNVSDDNYTNSDFGWHMEDIYNAYVSRVRGGYIIVLPPPVQLKD